MSTYELGIELGADEAINELGQLHSALSNTATAEDKVVAASKRATAQYDAEAKAARALANDHRAQENARRESTNAQNEGARASANAERERLLAYRASAIEAGKSRAALLEETRMKRLAKEVADEHARILEKEALAEKRAQAAEDSRVRSMALLEIQAHKLNAAGVDGEGKLLRTAKGADAASEGFNKLRPGVVALATSITGANGPLNSLIGTFGQLTVGGAVTVGVVAGGAAIAAIIGHVTTKTREQRKETDEAIKSLREYANAQKQGDAGKFGEQVARSTEELKHQRAELLRLQQSLSIQQNQRPSASLADDMGGFSFFDASKSTALRKQIAELTGLVREGQENVTRIEQDASAERLANLAKNGQLTAAQYAQARILIESNAREIARIQSEFAKSFVPDPRAVDQLLRLTAQNKALAESLDPVDKNSKKVSDQFAKTAAAAQLELDKQRELTAAWNDGTRAVEDINAKYARRVELAKIDEQYSGMQAKRLKELANAQLDSADAERARKRAYEDTQKSIVDALTKHRAVVVVMKENNTDLATGTGLLNAATASWERYAKAVADANGQKTGTATIMWDDSLVKSAETTLGLAAEIAQTLKIGGEGFANTIANAAGGMQNILSSVRNASRSGATSGDKLAAGGAIIGGIYAVGSAIAETWKPAATEATKAAQALRELRDAAKQNVAQYKLQAGGTDLEQTLYNLKQQFKALLRDLMEAGGVDPFGARKATPKSGVTEQDFIDAYDAYNKLVAKAIADAAKAAADAAAQAVKEAADEARRVQRSVNDLAIGRRAFTDPRGGNLAALEETQRRRLEDASTAAEKLEVALYNAAERADFFAKRMETDRRDAESSLGRILGAFGNDRVAQDATGAFSNRQEIVDLRAGGASEFNIALREFTQRTEALAIKRDRAFDDQSKAVNAQLDADLKSMEEEKRFATVRHDETIKKFNDLISEEKKQTDAAVQGIKERTKAQTDAIDAQTGGLRDRERFEQASISLMEESVRTQKQVVESLSEFLDASKLGPNSPLSPIDRQKEAERQYTTLLAAARRGDATAAGKLGGAADSLFTETRNVFASSVPATALFSQVQDEIKSVRDKFGATLPIDEQQLDAAKQGVAGIRSQLEQLEKQKQAIENASQKEIEAIQKISDSTIDGYNKQIDAENTRHDALLKKFDEEMAAAKTAADAQISVIRESVDAEFDRAVKADAFYENFRVYQQDASAFFTRFVYEENKPNWSGRAPGDDVLRPIPRNDARTVPTAGEVAIESAVREQNIVLGNQLTELRNTVSELRAMVAQLASSSTGAHTDANNIVAAIGESAENMRRSFHRASRST